MTEIQHLTMDQLMAGLDEIRQSPREGGVVEMIVSRPDVDAREILDEGRICAVEGLVGDNWRTRGSSQTSDDFGHPEMQLTLMNSRAIQLIAQDRSRWCLAGDQFFVDLDLSHENLPHGTRLKLGSSVIEITSEPHTGCKKFVQRFGLDAMKFVNSEIGGQLNLRGVNAKVIEDGIVRVGDAVTKCPDE